MELTRRGLFGLLAGLPLVGRLVPTTPKVAISVVAFNPADFTWSDPECITFSAVWDAETWEHLQHVECYDIPAHDFVVPLHGTSERP